MGDAAVRTTSDWMAVMRRMEHERADAYLRDPHAHLLTGEPAISQVEYCLGIGGPFGVIIGRGRFGDSAVEQAVSAGVRQVVSLGAGSDTRPWRLPLPADLTWYEVDLPGQLDGKTKVFEEADLAPGCRRECVEADLRQAWDRALGAVGHDASKPTAWVAEGLFYYLERPDALAVTDTLTRLSAPGSRVVFDVPHPGFVTDPEKAEFARYMSDRGSPFVGAAEHPAELLRDTGWVTEAYRSPTSKPAGAPGWTRCRTASPPTTISSGTPTRAADRAVSPR